ncbi:MAG TPA: hypothetical protein PJ990_04235 [Saprospiraceae bacterium]|nr:hypothetical protein [Saprospiraceae bacterium]
MNCKFEKYRIADANCDHRVTGPFGVDGVTLTATDAAVKYVRSKFLKMYQNNPSYFWTNGSMAWWQSVSGKNFLNSNQLSTWLNSQKYNSSWLNYITIE